MYAVQNAAGTAQLMDVYLAGSPSEVTTWSNTNFDRHYNGNRQPFGIYIHPSKLALCNFGKQKANILLNSSFDKLSWSC